jgi:hypothetical protein
MSDRTVDRWFAGALMVAAGYLVVAGSAGWFVFDDWLLLGSRRDTLEQDGVVAYFLRSHNDHLMAGVIAWHHLTVKLFGLGSYLPSMISIAAAHVAIAVLLRLLLLRLGVRRALASAAAVLMMLWGAAAGAMFWGLEASFAVVIGLWLGQLLLVWHDGPADRRDVLGAVVGLVAVASHSVAVPGLVVIVVMQLAGRRWRGAMLAMVPFVPYGLWFITYRQQPSVYARLPGEVDFGYLAAPWRDQVEFFRAMFSATFGGLLPEALALAVLIAAVVLVMWRDARRGDPRRPVLFGVLAYAVLFAAATARTRALFGVQFAASYRYVYVMTILLLPFLVLALQHLGDEVGRRWRPGWGRAVISLPLVVLAVLNVRMMEDGRQVLRLYMDAAKGQILALAAQPDLDVLPGSVRVDAATFDLNVNHVRRLVHVGWLPTDTPIPAEILAEQRVRLFGPTGADVGG